ncbi:MAG: hypothetical protein IBX56_18675, partial [Methylomicrobium sp.]|nr:hypothetical protein [Methylomicrobium sp.]
HDALPYLRQPEQGCVDVYWSASLNNFLQLKQEGVWHGFPGSISNACRRTSVGMSFDFWNRYDVSN